MAQLTSKDIFMEKQLPRKEVRFAVVMYGGISLAIYIHGVAQELLSLVRATARDKSTGEPIISDDKLEGAELVYRCLGRILKAKFVVDILSGTSAGGINAVYLAKALVNNKSMKGLKELWIREGDIAKLINDADSLDGLGGLPLREPPEGLLNSQRMYYKLLEALKTMGSSDAPSPYVEELDLNITATDIRGVNLPISISNSKVDELRYKTVFRFKYATKKGIDGKRFVVEKVDRNDFRRQYDPFLAFAARCTSSIPPAFEAMQLKDIEAVLKTDEFKEEYRDVLSSETDLWKAFYADYSTSGDNFTLRSFGDGGYLDNKPFSYATESLLKRHSELPVDRKLVYIEPSPEHPEDRPYSEDRPNMLQNIAAALVGLPRQETIREDLKTLLDRNGTIGRRNKVLAEVNDLFYKTLQVNPQFKDELEKWRQPRSDWPTLYLDELVATYGTQYPVYHQLRVESVLDTLTSVFARAMGWDVGGPEAKDLRVLFTAWRAGNYRSNSVDAERTKSRNTRVRRFRFRSENEILYRLDLDWRRRRMYFVQTLANVLLDSLPDEELQFERQRDMGPLDEEPQPEGEETAFQELSDLDWPAQGVSADRYRSVAQGQATILHQLSESSAPDDQTEVREYRMAVRELKEKLNLVSVEFNYEIDRLQQDRLIHLEKIDEDLQGYADGLRELYKILTAPSNGSVNAETTLRRLAGLVVREGPKSEDPVLQEVVNSIEELAAQLSPHYETKVEDSSAYRIKHALRALASESVGTLGLKSSRGSSREFSERLDTRVSPQTTKQVQKCLGYFYDLFELYDMLMFPLQFGTDFGESDEVEIVRVSPEDATVLLNERQAGRHKLAGTKLSNFGAFFKQEWRENDMLWGRLDAVEILLKELLKDLDQADIQKLCGEVLACLPGKLRRKYQAAGASQNPTGTVLAIAFERVLEQDLRPRDRSLFYDFVNGNLKPEADRQKERPPKSRLLDELIKKKVSIERLEADLRSFRSDTRLQRLESDISRSLESKPNFHSDQLEQELTTQIKAAQAKKKELEGQIKSEQARLKKQPMGSPSDNPDIREKLDDAQDFLQSVPEMIQMKAQDLLSQIKRTDDIRYRDLLRAVARDGELLHYFRHGYDVNLEFDLEDTVKAADRSARTMSRLFQNLSEGTPAEKYMGYLAFVLQVASAVVSLALPKSLFRFLFFGYWIGLLYVAEAIVWLAGVVTGNSLITNVGLGALVATSVLHVLVYQLNRLIERAVTRPPVVWILRGTALIALLVGGVGFFAKSPDVMTAAVAILAMLAGGTLAIYVFQRRDATRWTLLTTVILLLSVLLSIFWLGIAEALGKGTPPEFVVRLSRLLFDWRSIGIGALASLIAGALLDRVQEFARRLLEMRWPWQRGETPRTQNRPG